MYDFNNYDNDMAYSYDDYVEEKEEDLEQEEYNFEKYQEQMIEHLIDTIRKDI
jgi:ATPase subunit of ABC transporter with duplicated ATPase domains